MKQFLKNHKKDFIVWGLVLLIFVLVVLIVYFENQDKKHYVNVACNSDISIIDDDIELKKDLIYNTLTYTTNDFNITDDFRLYLKDFNNNDTFTSANLQCLRFNLSSIKNGLLSYNNNNYAVDLSNIYMSIYFHNEYYLTSGGNYLNLYFNFTNENINYNYIKSASPNFRNYFVDDCIGGAEFKVNFDYTYLDIFYISYAIDEREDEWFVYLDKFNIFDSASIYYNQQLEIENNALNERIYGLENENEILSSSYNSLDINYQNLLSQYNTLLNSTEYSFSELFWSISAVPFGVLTSAFNVDVLGVNLAGIVTGLFTAMLLIWLFKKFFK